jgi:hypothetical protein
MSKYLLSVFLLAANCAHAVAPVCTWINPGRSSYRVVTSTLEIVVDDGRGECNPTNGVNDYSNNHELIQANPASDRLLGFADGGFAVSADLVGDAESTLGVFYATQPQKAGVVGALPREQTNRLSSNLAMVLRARRQNGQLIVGWAKSVNGVQQPLEYLVKADSSILTLKVRWNFTAAGGLHTELQDQANGIVVSHDEPSFGQTVPELEVGTTTASLAETPIPGPISTAVYGWLKGYAW